MPCAVQSTNTAQTRESVLRTIRVIVIIFYSNASNFFTAICVMFSQSLTQQIEARRKFTVNVKLMTALWTNVLIYFEADETEVAAIKIQKVVSQTLESMLVVNNLYL
jgi:hypothetical protein